MKIFDFKKKKKIQFYFAQKTPNKRAQTSPPFPSTASCLRNHNITYIT